MKLRVQYMAQLRAAIGRSEEEIELSGETSVAALLAHLATQMDGEAVPHLLTSDGKARPSLLVVVNDAAIADRELQNVVLRSGDVVTLLPPIAGG